MRSALTGVMDETVEEVSENSEKREELESDPFRGGKSCVATGERPEGPGISAASPARSSCATPQSGASAVKECCSNTKRLTGG